VLTSHVSSSVVTQAGDAYIVVGGCKLSTTTAQRPERAAGLTCADLTVSRRRVEERDAARSKAMIDRVFTLATNMQVPLILLTAA
jgi:hypothetical protein